MLKLCIFVKYMNYFLARQLHAEIKIMSNNVQGITRNQDAHR